MTRLMPMDELRELLLSSGAAQVGFADLSPVPEAARGGFPYGILIAVALDPAVILQIESGPTPNYFDDYNRANGLLVDLGNHAVQFLRGKGFRSHMVRPTTEEYDRITNSDSFQHKTTATRAGLGWIGKSALLVTREYGSAIRLGTVLTEAPVQIGKPIETSMCGACKDCIERCPAGAPSGREWCAGMEREEFFVAGRCRDRARALSGEIGLNKTICGICIAVCPWTQEFLRKHT
jgi:epoxyqueuosine reductase